MKSKRDILAHTDYDIRFRRLLDETISLAQVAAAADRKAEAAALVDAERALDRAHRLQENARTMAHMRV